MSTDERPNLERGRSQEGLSHARFAEQLKQPGLIAAPGVLDMVSAKIADTRRFRALHLTGFGVVASDLGLADAGLCDLQRHGRIRGADCKRNERPFDCRWG